MTKKHLLIFILNVQRSYIIIVIIIIIIINPVRILYIVFLEPYQLCTVHMSLNDSYFIDHDEVY